MIRHVVMWRVAGDSAAERAQARVRVKQALEAYASDPAHMAVRDRLAGPRFTRHQVDYAVD